MASGLCLVLGGVRSGKSAFAESKVAALPQPTLYVATGVAVDEEMYTRIQRHQRSRPAEWATLEEPTRLAEKLGPALSASDGPGSVIIDSVDVWVANLLMERQTETKESIERSVMADADDLLGVAAASSQAFVIVSSEVGLSLVPPEPLGRRFQDLLGMVNQKIAAAATEVFLVAAGLPIQLKPASVE
ncbi:MAG: bifunctional adenosylcobinamide kinase/adenosylcobinamide-phosphate guanylyltransferase [Chloroflexi bacterium]|nr:bifunctional adenosylcobinamide kinase/adenosylcobinamide-phosphate guanylyltransferase [Chloroflexota bacterium]MDA1270958.1 bifunctional adenosylcobinamide kinase/adenosylcobinamide-phosphate guanylyltransferase [Chloroflexota bacterium]PKB59014.1 MAG: bifunctional adenosylcobinamide kinase/adenosylcobinamide-phosphate guanylyltransferase [SAR202 cluster bacterium Casp-Chloro-G2]